MAECPIPPSGPDDIITLYLVPDHLLLDIFDAASEDQGSRYGLAAVLRHIATQPAGNSKVPDTDPQASPADRASGPPGHIKAADLLALADELDGGGNG